MKKFCVSLRCFCIIFVFFAKAQASEGVSLSGKLTKYYYPSPQIVKNPAFGWFLELNGVSAKLIEKQCSLLPKKDRQLFKELGLKQDVIQCIQSNQDILNQMRLLEGKMVEFKGELSSPCLSRYHLCYSLEPTQITSKTAADCVKTDLADYKIDCLSERFCLKDDFSVDESPLLEIAPNEQERLVTLKGKLVLKLFPGPPEYDSIENGDRADYCWLLQMDEESFEVATTTLVSEPASSLNDILKYLNHNEINLLVNEKMQEFCCDRVNQEIVVKGTLFHAHTIHHYTPILMSVCTLELKGMECLLLVK